MLTTFFTQGDKNKIQVRTGFVQVLENLESPEILLWHFPGLESPGKGLLVLESAGNLLNPSGKFEMHGRQLGELTLRSGECKGKCEFQSPGKINQSPKNVLEKSWKFVLGKGYKP